MTSSAQTILRDNILAFWDRLRDPSGGFFGEADFNGKILRDAPRGAVLNARIIWACSAAYNALGERHYLEMAKWAGEYFLSHFIDKEYGGVYWSVDAEGFPLEDKKQSYAQAFGIYGLSELFIASGDGRYLSAAIDLWNTLESRFADSAHGGYTEALARDFGELKDMSLSEVDINAPKTMNSHLHLAEAFANLYRAWPSERLGAATERLLDILTGPMMGEDGHLGLYFTPDWTWLPSHPSPGHDIEASWLLMECALALKDPALAKRLKSRCLALAKAAGRPGECEQWWVYAEFVVGNLWLYRFHGDDKALEKARECFGFIDTRLVCPDGEWYWGLLPGGEPDPSYPMAGFWKCPYHNTRMCLQIIANQND